MSVVRTVGESGRRPKPVAMIKTIRTLDSEFRARIRSWLASRSDQLVSLARKRSPRHLAIPNVQRALSLMLLPFLLIANLARKRYASSG